jgi:hypothetical protein
MMHLLLKDKDLGHHCAKKGTTTNPCASVQLSNSAPGQLLKTPELMEYDKYLKHMREQAVSANTLSECAAYLLDHAELMCQIPEFIPSLPIGSAGTQAGTQAPHGPRSIKEALDACTPRQLLGHLTRTILRDWFVSNAGLRYDGRDQLRISPSTRAFWFSSPCCAAGMLVRRLRARAFAKQRKESHRSATPVSTACHARSPTDQPLKRAHCTPTTMADTSSVEEEPPSGMVLRSAKKRRVENTVLPSTGKLAALHTYNLRSRIKQQPTSVERDTHASTATPSVLSYEDVVAGC